MCVLYVVPKSKCILQCDIAERVDTPTQSILRAQRGAHSLCLLHFNISCLVAFHHPLNPQTPCNQHNREHTDCCAGAGGKEETNLYILDTDKTGSWDTAGCAARGETKRLRGHTVG